MTKYQAQIEARIERLEHLFALLLVIYFPNIKLLAGSEEPSAVEFLALLKELKDDL